MFFSPPNLVLVCCGASLCIFELKNLKLGVYFVDLTELGVCMCWVILRFLFLYHYINHIVAVCCGGCLATCDVNKLQVIALSVCFMWFPYATFARSISC